MGELFLFFASEERCFLATPNDPLATEVIRISLTETLLPGETEILLDRKGATGFVFASSLRLCTCSVTIGLMRYSAKGALWVSECSCLLRIETLPSGLTDQSLVLIDKRLHPFYPQQIVFELFITSPCFINETFYKQTQF